MAENGFRELFRQFRRIEQRLARHPRLIIKLLAIKAGRNRHPSSPPPKQLVCCRCNLRRRNTLNAMWLIKGTTTSDLVESRHQMLAAWCAMRRTNLNNTRLPRRETCYRTQHRHGQIERMADPLDDGSPCRCRNMREPRVTAHIEPRHRNECRRLAERRFSDEVEH